ncbi:MAG: HNH endonuclease [Planctomycetes bacterium]|nr:HNH endonuclease [Planctomycetota bacterium]
MNSGLRRLVRRRAGDRCEYCRMHQYDDPALTFHVEHIIAKQHGGSDSRSNLAWSCHKCNRAKGPNLSGLVGNDIVPLFHPRRQKWSRHFRWSGARIRGKTKTGKATVAVLNLNAPERIALRQALIAGGLFPPW